MEYPVTHQADVTYGPILERAVMFMKQGVVTLPETEGVKVRVTLIHRSGFTI